MKFSFDSKGKGDLLVVPFWEGPELAGACELDLREPLADFKGKEGEISLFYCGQRVLLLGLGKQNRASVEALRRAYSAVVKFAKSKSIKAVDVIFPKCKQKEEFFRGIAEGLLLSNYVFTYKNHSLKDQPISMVEKVSFLHLQKPQELKFLEILAEGVKFVRDLVNENADVKVPKVLAKIANELHPRVKSTVFEKKRLHEEKMGLLLAVARASEHEPVLIQASYQGGGTEHIVLVGKGVTYDTGGLSLKPTDGMLGMKCDMAGAATVLGAVKVAAELGLKVNVTAVVPATENCIGSKSYKLGDVYRGYSGKTVEINNTDAEGRLILADAISYAVDQLNPSCIVDLATLTGACVVALGEEIAGLFSNDDSLAEELMESSEAVDELLCRLPVHSAYRESFKSEIADLVNSGGREAGAIKAALFLKEFVQDVPWAHLDIAGPAFWHKAKHYHPMRGTGFGLRLLVDFLIKRSL